MTGHSNARFIIVGGGVIGLSVAYHLAMEGADDVLLLERHQLTSGTSWHAAGIVGPLRASMNLTRLATYATELFPQLEKQSGLSTGWRRTGGLWLAGSAARRNEIRRIKAMGDITGLAVSELGPEDIAAKAPFLRSDDLAGAIWVEDDGQANPVDLCMAYAKVARSGGVRIRENAEVVTVLTRNESVAGVTLAGGETVRCEKLINCAGAWGAKLGELANVPVPLQAVEHMYVITEPVPELPNPLPIVRDLDRHIYIKGDAGRVVLGGFEANAKVWNPEGPNGQQPFLELPEDWHQFEPFMQAGLDRLPALATAGITHFMNGPESFTPDSRQLMGESPFLHNYFVAAGFNSIGMMSSAGVGKAMAYWMLNGEAPMDLWEVDIARFDRDAASPGYLAARMDEAVSDVFAMHWPGKQSLAGRDLKRGTLHSTMAGAGAVFGAPTRWERPLWFAENEHERRFNYSYSDQWWWPYAQRECDALVSDVVLLELSPFTKIDIAGSNALDFLQYCCAGDIDVAVGACVYTPMLNARGGIEADVTVTRTGENRFRIISAAATRQRDCAHLDRIRRHRSFSVTATDVTDDESVIGVSGPRSRQLVAELVDCEIGNENLRFGHAQCCALAGRPIRLVRLGFTGELGYEIHVPNADAVAVHEHLIAAGQAHRLHHMGHLALDSCRLEKGYRHFGHDLGPDTTALEAGLGFAVALDKGTQFVGRDALVTQRDRGLTSRLLLFSLGDEHPLMLHDEPIYLDGEIVGITTSGGRGFRTGLTLCLGYVRCREDETMHDLTCKTYSVDVAGERYTLYPLAKAPWDPDRARQLA